MFKPSGPRPFGAWVKYYEDKSESKFELLPNEELVQDREHGFFTWMYNREEHYLVIPKMCGDGKFWRPYIHEMLIQVKQLDPDCKGVWFCTKRNAQAYMRIVGGRLVDEEDANGKHYSYIVVNLEDTKVPRR